MAVLLCVATLAVTACGSSGDDGSAKANDKDASDGDSALLGSPNAATGAPVKVGLITNGKSAALDNSVEEPVTKAAVGWMNDFREGIGGHKIQLVTCVENGDAGKAVDCGNRMVADDVVAVLYGSNSVADQSWRPLHDAGIPTFLVGSSSPPLGEDAKSTFLIGSSKGSVIDLPLGVAKDLGKKRVTAIIIDVPAATGLYKDPATEAAFRKEGVALDLVPIPLGTPDTTAQMTQVVSKNPDGVVFVLGTDSLCIAIYNGLTAAGFKGTITAYEGCVTDATRAAVPKEVLEGMVLSAAMPQNDTTAKSTKFFNAVLDRYARDVDRHSTLASNMFLSAMGFRTAVEGLQGDVTSKTVIAAAKSMKWSELPGGGGRHIRCNGKADPLLPAVCSNSQLSAVLGANGKPNAYKVVSDEMIPD